MNGLLRTKVKRLPTFVVEYTKQFEKKSPLLLRKSGETEQEEYLYSNVIWCGYTDRSVINLSPVSRFTEETHYKFQFLRLEPADSGNEHVRSRLHRNSNVFVKNL